jgi:hypothetical protein
MPRALTLRRKALRHAAARGLTGAKLREEARKLANEELEAGITSPSATLTASEYAASVRIAQRHDARMALRLTSRRDGSLVVRAFAPTSTRQRGISRERRPQGRPSASRSASRDGPRRSEDPEPPPLARLGGAL